MLLKLLWIAAALAGMVLAQDSQSGQEAASASTSEESVEEKWDYFVHETAAPFTLGAGAFNATVSQVTRSAPLYGRHWNAYPKRFGASVGDIVSQNFFGDFVLASTFHEDTRYRRMGPVHGVWRRMGYAISRAVVTRTDSGEGVFNWANVVGCAMSAGLSNSYYPPVSRTASVALVNWGTNIAGAGLTNIAPEFGSDVAHWFKRHHRH